MDTSVVDVELGIEAKPGLESLDTDGSIDVLCLACDSAAGDFTVRSMRRRTPNPHDVVIDMKYCGVCHSDVHLHDGYFDLGGGSKLDMARALQPPPPTGGAAPCRQPRAC